MKNPILFDFPNEFTTEQLLIRSPKPGDGQTVWEAVNASRNELKPWLAFAVNEESIEDTETNIRDSYIKFMSREDLRLLVFHKETGKFIASSGLHRIDWDVPKFEIGYWIDSRMSGLGYMTEAVKGITDFAFTTLGARRIEIRCNSLNLKSRVIPEKLGYRLEGTLENHSIDHETGKLIDTCVFAKVRKD
ncbi:GNAT family N-acetyltransferase [Jeotgalibacillus proteolyticus]|uniref:GNAT family N-acetyltransferase n=1 Tax=Jeotgalibacillus proteolyticus TaxID=2082395 RepID=A0A2S5GD96_9BACL|nr:GNAT family N-acetyltransferase [Jeotgalibacillus proteolyticus]PPA70895.1 GNAT family N-acetyltransferase [Jeotgalibacillus proteolyticus]